MEIIIKNMFFAEVQEDSYLFEQNDNASSFFLIHQGLFQLEIDGKKIKEFTKGDSFGELALLYNEPRSGSIKALKKSNVWGIHGAIFKKCLKEINN